MLYMAWLVVVKVVNLILVLVLECHGKNQAALYPVGT